MDERIEQNAINPNNGNENSNNKTNTFNLIIGISTLLIAILGATFAYFSATARGNENAVSLKSAFVSISYDEGTEIKASNLIPATIQVALTKFRRDNLEAFEPTYDEKGNEIGYDTNYDEYADGDVNRRCVDSRGKEVCYVYQFSIKSESAAETTDIIAYIKVNTNEFENLSYVLYEVEYETKEVTLPNGSVEVRELRDKYGIRLVKKDSYNVVSKFSNFDETSADFSKTGFEKFERPQLEKNDDGSFNKYKNPIACLFGRSDDYETKDINDTTRCKEYQMKNYNINEQTGEREIITHYYQLVIWLNETHQLQEEQGKVFEGTIEIEVSGGLDGANYENNQITGKE